MERDEAKRLISKIKAYYYYFSLDKDSLIEWNNRLKDYDYQDVDNRLMDHLKGENAKDIPQLHFLIRNLLTVEQKRKQKKEYIVECNLCHRWMSLSEYDAHYDKCLTVEYLVNTAKAKGESITRKEIENCRQEVIDKLYKKYPPEVMTLKKAVDEIT